MLRDVFGFPEHQKRAKYGLGYNLTLTRNSDSSVLNKNKATIIGKNKIISIEGYRPHYTPSVLQHAFLSNQNLSKLPTELQHVEISVFMKEVKTQLFWTFELGTQEGINVRMCIIVGFQQKDRQDSQILNNDTFYRPPVTNAQCIIGTETNPDSAVLLIYDDDDFSPG